METYKNKTITVDIAPETNRLELYSKPVKYSSAMVLKSNFFENSGLHLKTKNQKPKESFFSSKSEFCLISKTRGYCNVAEMLQNLGIDTAKIYTFKDLRDALIYQESI